MHDYLFKSSGELKIEIINLKNTLRDLPT